MRIEKYVARRNSRSRRVRRAWSAVFFVMLVLSACFAALAVCGAIIGGAG